MNSKPLFTPDTRISINHRINVICGNTIRWGEVIEVILEIHIHFKVCLSLVAKAYYGFKKPQSWILHVRSTEFEDL